MKILIDMNLSPEWENTFKAAGFEAKHWSTVGPWNAKDEEIFQWAQQNQYIIFTHDLDFSAILASSQSHHVSVIQVRTQAMTPQRFGNKMLKILDQFEKYLNSGALISIDEANVRVQILPLTLFKSSKTH